MVKKNTDTRSKSARRRSRPKKPRLYSRGIVISFRRSRHKQRPNRSIVQVEGVRTIAETDYYLGKRVAFMYALPENSTRRKVGPKFLEGKRVIYGNVTRRHGNSGCVQVQFERNLPGWSKGMKCRVYMYPQTE